MAKTKTVTDLFQEHLGAHEYDDFVTKMIRWYYDGGFAKVAWCAISMSYMMNQLGLLDQIGGKNQNCYRMLVSTEGAIAKTHKGKLLYKKDLKNGQTIKRGSIIFILKSAAPMTEMSEKHVTSAYEDFVYNGTGWFDALGGNQSDYIRVTKYAQKNIYAVFEPDYNAHKTLRKGDSGEDVKELQKDLTALGFGRITGVKLACRGNFKNNTENVVKAFQRLTGCCSPDGVAGPRTWAKIDELLAVPVDTTTALTNVYVRTGPGKEYKKAAKILEGNSVSYTIILNGWMYIPKKHGWSMTRYYKF